MRTIGPDEQVPWDCPRCGTRNWISQGEDVRSECASGDYWISCEYLRVTYIPDDDWSLVRVVGEVPKPESSLYIDQLLEAAHDLPGVDS